jgi:hypothetical protein
MQMSILTEGAHFFLMLWDHLIEVWTISRIC